MTQYARGRRFEWKLAKQLRERGALVMRSAGSHGEADLMALWPHSCPWAIQAKTRKPTKAERTKIVQAARYCAGVEWWLVWPADKGENWEKIG